MKTNKNLIIIVLALFVFCFSTSCEDNSEAGISGKLIETTEDVLMGDSVYLTVEFDGGSPPFAFRYFFMGTNPSSGVYGKQYRYMLGINERSYTFGLLPTDTTTYTALSVASYYNNVGPATGSAVFNIVPVDYIYEETINATKTGFIQKSLNSLNISTDQLQLRGDATNFARIIYLEFDAADFKNIEEKSKYVLRFWLVSSHSTGVNKSSVMEVSGKLGSMEDNMTWETQPKEEDLIHLFRENFKTTGTTEQIEFSGEINSIVYKALENSGSKKFTIRITENLQGKGSGGLYYIGSHLFDEEAKRPYVDVQLRRAKSK